jgi:hypothetical protein
LSLFVGTLGTGKVADEEIVRLINDMRKQLIMDKRL